MPTTVATLFKTKNVAAVDINTSERPGEYRGPPCWYNDATEVESIELR